MELDVNKGLDAIKKYKIARTNFLVMCILTIVNVILIVLKTNYYFLFSASIPVSCAYLSIEDPFTLVNLIILIIGLSVIAVLFVIYLLSNKSYLAMIAATVIFAIDTIFFIFEIIIALSVEMSFDWILDFLFHCWIMYYFIIALKNGKMLLKMPNGVSTTSEEFLYYVREASKQEEKEELEEV